MNDPQHLYSDQIAFTPGYNTAIYLPSIFDRGERFTETNYQQYLVQKSFGQRMKASVD